MSITFVDLVKFYRKAKNTDASDKCTYFIETSEELDLVKNLVSDNNYQTTKLAVDNGSITVGSQITVSVGLPDSHLGRVYETIEKFLVADMASITNESNCDVPYYIFSEKVASFDEKIPHLLQSYHTLKLFILQLKNMATYTDVACKNLIFLGKKALALSIDIRTKITPFMMELEQNNEESLALIRNFTQWLKNSDASNHRDEIKSILAFVLSDILMHKPDIIQVIRKIEEINESAKAQYALYIENFSYSKFVKKLEENNEKFVRRINETINKILPQLLGLPFLAAIITAFQEEGNLFVYAALFIYSLVSLLALRYQKTILDDISDEINTYEKRGNIPEALKMKWSGYESKFHKLIKKQKLLYYVLFLSAFTCLLYSLYKACNYEYFHNTILIYVEYFFHAILNYCESFLHNIELNLQALSQQMSFDPNNNNNKN